MAAWVELEVLRGNDVTLELALTSGGEALDLTAASALELFVKPHRTSDDDADGVVKLTLDEGLAITDAVAGLCEASLSKTQLASAGLRWWRIDAVIDGQRRTAMRGPLRVADT